MADTKEPGEPVVVSSPTSIDVSKPYILHICGYNFHAFRQGFHQPYDPIFQQAMVLTMNDLLLAFQACTGHTHMFDIVLVFDRHRSRLTMDPERLLTMYTSYATVRFNHHMAEQIQNPFYVGSYPPGKVAAIMSRQSLFYANFVQPSSAQTTSQPHPMLKWLVDRCRHHALTQTVFLWAQTLLGSDKCQHKTRDELIQLLLVEKAIQWTTDIPIFMSYGVVGKLDINPRSDARPYVCNRAVIFDDRDWTFQWVMAPHWPITKIPQFYGDIVETHDIFNVSQFGDVDVSKTTTEATK